MRLLIVEDSPKLIEWLAKAFSQSGYAVDRATDGAAADALLRTESYDAVILDLSLPGVDGLTLLQRLRERGRSTPVVVLTARSGLDDRVEGLNLGADYYLTKPFELSELEACLAAVIRRSHGICHSRLSLGKLSYDCTSRIFTVEGDRLSLRPKEHSVLEALMLRIGKPVSKTAIYEQVFSIDKSTGSDVVEIYIHRLRKQLQPLGVIIVTMRGLGYVLEAA